MKKCLFLDTETTGLSGGAGTVAFLVGAAWVEDEELVTEQYILGDHSDEPEMLLRLGELLKRFDTAVTFNGKTFDMPLLESRYTLCRLRDHWRELDQLDLLHPARRVWKLRLQSCRLAHLEERVLGVRRENDLPGSEAPERFFRYLQTGDFSLLEEVIAHNLQDVITLAVLLVKLAQLFDERFDERVGRVAGKPDKARDIGVPFGRLGHFGVELDDLGQVHGVGAAVDDVAAGVRRARLVRH